MPSTALIAIEAKHPSYTPAEMRARSIISRLDSVCAKLKTLEDDIRILWVDFDNLKDGETILGCATKKEFCEKKLQRTPRTIQYLLAGQSNSNDRPRPELSSPVECLTATMHLPNGTDITMSVGDWVTVQRKVNLIGDPEFGKTRMADEPVRSVTGGRCDSRLYRVVTKNFTSNSYHFDANGKSYGGDGQIIGLATVAESPVSNRETKRQEFKQTHPEFITASNHEVDDAIRQQFCAQADTTPETRWIHKDNHCPTGKRGFDYPDDIWQLMRLEGSIEATDFIAYITKCGQCGRCHRDKDQSCHKENDPEFLAGRGRHQTWYRPDELNPAPVPAETPESDIKSRSGYATPLPWDERCVKAFGEDCFKRHEAETDELKKGWGSTGANAAIKWAPLAPDPDHCSEYSPDEDRYKIELFMDAETIRVLRIILSIWGYNNDSRTAIQKILAKGPHYFQSKRQ